LVATAHVIDVAALAEEEEEEEEDRTERCRCCPTTPYFHKYFQRGSSETLLGSGSGNCGKRGLERTPWLFLIVLKDNTDIYYS
jgi:hypothetical protein